MTAGDGRQDQLSAVWIEIEGAKTARRTSPAPSGLRSREGPRAGRRLLTGEFFPRSVRVGVPDPGSVGADGDFRAGAPILLPGENGRFRYLNAEIIIFMYKIDHFFT